MEFVSFIDTRKGKKLLKVFKSQRAANMFLKKNTDKILSKRDIESVGTMSKKEWDTKEAKYAIEGFSSDAQRKAAFANGYEEKDKKNEGKKRFKRQDGIGKAKYTISFHDGKKKHKDGSDFFDIKIFKNKKDLSDFVGTLAKQGYKLTRESVNEGKFKVDDLVYNKRTKTVGIVRMGDDKYGEVKTDADGNVDVDKLEKYNPIKFKHQTKAKVAPSTEKEVSKRGLFNPFKNESVNEKRGFVTKMLNKKLTIKRIGSRERFKDTKSGKVFKKDGFAFHIPGKGYIGYSDEKGMPYTPGGGTKALQQILDDGGFLDYKKLVLINPVDESVNEGISVSDERHFGKKGIIIMIDDNGKKVAAIFKDKKNADKFNRNKSSDIQKLLQLAKKTKYPKAIDESVNEAGKLAMGIAALTGTRGSAVQDFIDKNRINDKKLFKALKKANLQGRINFASALAGRPGNPNEKLTIKLFGESKKEVIAFRKKAKSETAFYDILDKIERKYGRGVFEKWLDKSLKDLKLNPKKYKTSADKQEALYQVKL